MTLPLPSLPNYVLNLTDSSQQNASSKVVIFPATDTRDCLINPRIIIPSSSPSPSASAGVAGSSDSHLAVIIAVPAIVGILLVVGVSFIGYRYVKRKQRLSRQEDRFEDRQYLKLEDVKVQQPIKAQLS